MPPLLTLILGSKTNRPTPLALMSTTLCILLYKYENIDLIQMESLKVNLKSYHLHSLLSILSDDKFIRLYSGRGLIVIFGGIFPYGNKRSKRRNNMTL
jgi:hypothetical protein